MVHGKKTSDIGAVQLAADTVHLLRMGVFRRGLQIIIAEALHHFLPPLRVRRIMVHPIRQ